MASRDPGSTAPQSGKPHGAEKSPGTQLSCQPWQPPLLKRLRYVPKAKQRPDERHHAHGPSDTHCAQLPRLLQSSGHFWGSLTAPSRRPRRLQTKSPGRELGCHSQNGSAAHAPHSTFSSHAGHSAGLSTNLGPPRAPPHIPSPRGAPRATQAERGGHQAQLRSAKQRPHDGNREQPPGGAAEPEVRCGSRKKNEISLPPGTPVRSHTNVSSLLPAAPLRPTSSSGSPPLRPSTCRA